MGSRCSDYVSVAHPHQRFLEIHPGASCAEERQPGQGLGWFRDEHQEKVQHHQREFLAPAQRNCGCPTPGMFKAGLDGAWSHQGEWKVSLPKEKRKGRAMGWAKRKRDINGGRGKGTTMGGKRKEMAVGWGKRKRDIDKRKRKRDVTG